MKIPIRPEDRHDRARAAKNDLSLVIITTDETSHDRPNKPVHDLENDAVIESNVRRADRAAEVVVA